MKRYLVGGAVRDILLGRPVVDQDYLIVDATPEAFVRRYRRARQVGKTFPVFMLGAAQYAWPRGDDINEDLLARDLTINAMAMGDSRHIAGRLHFHPLALADLRDRLLRPCGEMSMFDDPLRVYRAARFAASLPDFSPHPELIAQMRAIAACGALSDVFAERVAQEVRKALDAPMPSRFFSLLAETGCLLPWLPELEAARHIPAGPPEFHDGSIFEHMLKVVDKLAGEPLAGWMAVCHDLGKIATPQCEWPRHHGHDDRGVAIAEEVGRRLKLPNRVREAGVAAAKLHMKAARYEELRAGTRVDMLAWLHKHEMVEPLFALVRADSGHDVFPLAKRDLKVMLSVHLPGRQRQRGPISGERLRNLRCQKLAEHDKSQGRAPEGHGDSDAPLELPGD
ncbi:HD domain-containing protein [Desulfovibrio sp. TomC]|uniref:HD domain-containing protein n=1 Tax=Desulfovibrio sp. TomC TaxID=1562888 RepID=UPI000573C8F5|nr:HD domain-containing protein [Desulfovibrio sp. TomC]KHK01194.1 tRNA nucleotidyltransferase [Desulfovibrio sp. TomC]